MPTIQSGYWPGRPSNGPMRYAEKRDGYAYVFRSCGRGGISYADIEPNDAPLSSRFTEQHCRSLPAHVTACIRDMLTPNRNSGRFLSSINRRRRRPPSVATTPSDVPYGTLDLMVLKTLDALSPLHGYGIARRIEQVAQGSLALNQGTIYPALLRLEQKGWIKSEWGTSENNRRARFYSITRAGRKQLATEAESWARTVAMVDRLLGERS
jgi:PadR family transcriptional regulator, regulatory protein PadR